jgi:hypothetical protein
VTVFELESIVRNLSDMDLRDLNVMVRRRLGLETRCACGCEGD